MEGLGRTLQNLRTRKGPPMRFLVTGDLILDTTLVVDCWRDCSECEDAITVSERKHYNLGGAGNVARILAQWGHEVRLEAAVGGDLKALYAIMLERCEIENGLMGADWRNPEKIRVVSADGTIRCRHDVETVLPASWAGRFWECRDQDDWDMADVIVVSDYDKGLFSGGACSDHWALGLVRQGTPVVADFKPANRRAFYGATVVCPNEREAVEILGSRGWTCRGPTHGARCMRDIMGVQIAAVTVGRKGASYSTVASWGEVPAPVRGPFAVGAGDVFTAAMAQGVARYGTRDPRALVEEAVRLASESTLRPRDPDLVV